MVKRGKKVLEKNSSNLISGILSFVVWIVSILVSLAVGFGMIDGILTVRYVPEIVTVIAGWVVVILTLVGLVLALIGKLGK